jgi:ribosome assembly protein 1
MLTCANYAILQDIPPELQKKRAKKRGKRGGERTRWRCCFRAPMPSVISGNMRSIRNKSDELEALSRHHYQYRECGFMCFTETWLSDGDTDASVSILGFTLVRGDRT